MAVSQRSEVVMRAQEVRTLATWFSVVRTDGVLLKALAVGNAEIDGIASLGAAIGAAGLHTAGVRKRRSIVARIVCLGGCV